MANQDQAACQVGYTFCQKGQISQTWGVLTERWNTVFQGYNDQLLFVYDQLLFGHLESYGWRNTGETCFFPSRHSGSMLGDIQLRNTLEQRWAN